jgi:enoyl-CoA hydratase
MTVTSQPESGVDTGAGIRLLLDSDPPDEDVIDRVAVQRHGSVAVVTLSHSAARNALNLAGWRRLRFVFTELSSDCSLRAVVLRGAGEAAFAAGADITEFPQTRMTAAQASHYNESISSALQSLTTIPVPVIASVAGVAAGGGAELCAACDVRIASESARFGIPIGRLGVILGHTEALVVARLIGPAALKYLLFSGEFITAAEALRLGFVQKVVAVGDLAATTAELVGQICRQSPTTMRASKAVADMVGRALTGADADLLARLSVQAYEGEDLKRGVAAFIAGREPVFDAADGHGPNESDG